MPNTCHNEYVLELYMNLKVLVRIEYYFGTIKDKFDQCLVCTVYIHVL